jgi:hypothetical protein
LTALFAKCYNFLGTLFVFTRKEDTSIAAGRLVVKLENYTFNLVMKTLEILEKQFNYKVSDTVKKEIAEAVVKEMDSLISQ